MGRAPCCEKMGLNRGPWTPEEDQILVSYVQKHGHTNWRALPKLAGLLRCGKSCRLRWINYLKPDIKRGNFTPEEEDAIINLHHSLGNRWSAIAAKLPGRTDNEIKNVWHTHLKKRLKKNEGGNWPQQPASVSEYSAPTPTTTTTNTSEAESQALSPQPSFSGSSGAVSSVSDNTFATAETINYVEIPSEEEFPVLIDESLWSEAAEEEEELRNDSWEFSGDQYLQLDTQNNFLDFSVVEEINGGGFAPRMDEAMDFWYDMLVQAGELKDYEVITLTDVAPH